MNLKFQYNKTSLQNLDKQLKMRLRALPTLKNKESALRMEVKNARKKKEELIQMVEDMIMGDDNNLRMWNEFDDSLLVIERIKLRYRKIAGVEIPEPDEVEFRVKDFDLFNSPKWFPAGIDHLKKLMEMTVKRDLMEKQQQKLEYARKKTTQKVNLYEKVQIPSYENAIRRVKRYLEDEDNLAKAAQKIVKTRKQRSEEVAV